MRNMSNLTKAVYVYDLSYLRQNKSCTSLILLGHLLYTGDSSSFNFFKKDYQIIKMLSDLYFKLIDLIIHPHLSSGLLFDQTSSSFMMTFTLVCFSQLIVQV